jgi:hypothetical protein
MTGLQQANQEPLEVQVQVQVAVVVFQVQVKVILQQLQVAQQQF